MTVSIRIDEGAYKSVQEQIRRLRREFPGKAVSTLSKSLTKVKQVVVDRTYITVNLTKTRITQDINVIVQGNIEGVSLDNFKMLLTSTGKPLGLANFATNKDWNWKNPKPVRVKIYRTGTSYVFRHAFMAPGRGGVGMHVWERETYLGRPWNPKRHYSNLEHGFRFPIERMTTVRIQDIQGKEKFLWEVIQAGSFIVLGDMKLTIEEVVGNSW